MTRKIVATEYMSLDGVFEEPGQWSFPFWSEEAGKFKAEELFASDAQLLGRVTYEGFAAAWPSMTDDAGFAARMNGMQKYVVTSTLAHPGWNNTAVINGNVAEAVAELKAQPGQDIRRRQWAIGPRVDGAPPDRRVPVHGASSGPG